VEEYNEVYSFYNYTFLLYFNLAVYRLYDVYEIYLNIYLNNVMIILWYFNKNVKKWLVIVSLNLSVATLIKGTV